MFFIDIVLNCQIKENKIDMGHPAMYVHHCNKTGLVLSAGQTEGMSRFAQSSDLRNVIEGGQDQIGAEERKPNMLSCDCGREAQRISHA